MFLLFSFSIFLAAAIVALNRFWNATICEIVWRAIAVGDAVVSSESSDKRKDGDRLLMLSLLCLESVVVAMRALVRISN